MLRIALMMAGWCLASLAFAQSSPQRYIVLLEDAPVATRFASHQALASSPAGTYRQQIAAKQENLRRQLVQNRFAVTGSSSTVLNAIFVSTTPDRVAELSALPGVRGVVAARHYHRSLDRATQLVNAPAAWTALGGISNAGAGIKIAVLDTGIDQTNPAFQDPALPAPSGFAPVCDPTRINTCSQPAFTNNKVIVARSYVGLLAAGGAIDPNHPELDSRPDDLTPRDRTGHGTAVASCAAGVHGTVTSATAIAGGKVTIGGVAPKAYLGNYRIYGSPQVNDTTTSDIIITALEDAVTDGMDVVSFSSGAPAISGALDTGATCGLPAGTPCDPIATAFENAAQAGTIVVVSAGNDGAPGTIESPADAPSVITVGSSTSSHYFTPLVSALGATAPANLQNLVAVPTDGSLGTLTGPLRDVTILGDDGTACNALPAFSLPGYIALVQRGNCTFQTKVFNAIAAGATGVLVYNNSTVLAPVTLGSAAGLVTVLMIGQSDGAAMKAYIDANPNLQVTLDTNGAEQNDTAGANLFSSFSSQGPTIGPLLAKPEVVAPGQSPQSTYYGGVYMATQTYDPLGEMFSGTGFLAAEGTSFSTPITAGAAALVLQAHHGVTGAARLPLVRSAIVNNAAQSVTTDDTGVPVDGFEIGAGLLNAGAAVTSTLSVVPATLSFGVVSTTIPTARQLTVTNHGASAITLTVAVAPNTTLDFASTLTLNLSAPSLPLAPGASGVITVTPSGTLPASGYYSGLITFTGGGVSLVVPYVYMVGDGFVGYVYQDGGYGFSGTVGQDIPAVYGEPLIQVIDDYGLPIAGLPVTWTAAGPAGSSPTIVSADSVTNQFGVAGINQVVLGATPGTYVFSAKVPGYQTLVFSGTARLAPAIRTINPIENAATFDQKIAPGSYVAIFGSNLSDPGNTNISNTLRVPQAIDNVNVSFDVPSAGISVPGHLLYVSPTQVNVQVPWELQGQSAALVKVTVDYSPGNVINVPLSPFAPGFYGPAGTVAALDTDYRVINQSHPAVRGQFVQLYVTGLGPVTDQPASGEPAPIDGNPLSWTLNTVTVKIGPDTVVFNGADNFRGLAPGNAGLYQLNLKVPTDLQPGNQTMTITVGGVTSPASAMWVQ